MTEIIVETLLAERGNNYDETGQTIASYSRSIVFLPAGAEPGREVRVRLIPIEGKTDRRGRPMYQSEPAPVEYTERWKDNGDGTASRVKIAKDWFLQESEVEVVETRSLDEQDGSHTIHTDFRLVWGSDLSTSVVECHASDTIEEQKERVKGDQLVWRKVGDRRGAEEITPGEVTKIEAEGYEWQWHRLDLQYDQALMVVLKIWFDASRMPLNYSPRSFLFKWGGLPAWLRAEMEARYPVCSCGRQRRDTQVADGYAKCELCRAKETCGRCGKQTKVTVVDGRLVCENCQPYEEQEQLIAAHLTGEHRQAIADEAKRLLSGQALEGELGLAVLKAGLGHVHDWTRDRILQKWSGYRWYYFTNEGVLGTKFEPAALQVLQYLPQATGNSLVELVAWVAENRPKGSRGLDYYLRTQVEGLEGELPQLTEDRVDRVVYELSSGEPVIVLADWLRGSEAERLAALEAYRQAEQELGAERGTIRSCLNIAHGDLFEESQAYAHALQMIAEAFAEKAKRQVLDDLLAREYSSCPVCGSEWNFREEGPHYCERQDELRARGSFQDFEVKVSRLRPPTADFGGQARLGEAELVKLLAVYDDRYGDYELRLEVNNEVLVDDPGQVETKTYWREPSARERELAEQIGQLQGQLMVLDRERSFSGRVEGAFKKVEHRGKTQLQFEGTFTGTVDDRSAEEGYSSYEDQPALFVCRDRCPWLDEEPQAGQRWVCTTAFQIGMTGGKPVIVANPQVRSDLEEELKQKIARLQQEQVVEQRREADLVDEAFDEEGNPTTALAAALRKAGLV